MSDPIRFTMLVTCVGTAILGYWVITQDKYTPTGSQPKDLRKKYQQVAFRDPKLVEEHQKKLDEINKKNSK